MKLEPTHPHSLALHHQVRDHLEENLKTWDYFVWINVRPTGAGDKIGDLDIAGTTDDWLAALPEHEHGKTFERVTYDFEQATVVVIAVPKIPEARTGRAYPVVGNPEPVLGGYGP
jgi:hypothetical protein